MANLVLLFLSVSDGWPPLLIFCSWQAATLLLASSRNWCLITGKARIWSEGSHWLWEETALQGVGERWPSPLTCEKTKPLFPSAASLPKSTAAHTSVASKGNKKSPAPASRLTFFLPHFCRCLCTPEMLAPPWTPGCPWSGLWAARCRCQGSRTWESSSRTAAHAWHSPSWDTQISPGLGQEREEEAPNAYLRSKIAWASINGTVHCFTDKTLALQKPGLPKTRAYLFIHHLHLIFFQAV